MVRPRPLGSIETLGTDFQSFRINDLEMVDQTEASWNPLISWLRWMDSLRQVA